MDGHKQRNSCILCIIVVVVVGVIVLLTQSYSDLHYYEIGFAKSKTTGSVNTEKVYTRGRTWLGPDKTFKAFDSVGQTIDLPSTTVFAAPDVIEGGGDDVDLPSSSGASLTITISITIVYFLIPEDLQLLHDEYDVDYHPLMEKSAKSALKDAASRFTQKQFYREREMVENELLLGVQKRLSGMCCPVNCNVSNCFDGCIPRDQCKDTDKGLFVDARYLQLTDLIIPYEVEQRNLRTLIITEETAEEQFTQQAAVITKETEQLVQEIRNDALEVTANSTAQAGLIRAKSEARYRKILEEARREGLVLLFDSLGLAEAGHKNSFDYLRSLGDNANAHLTVDFDQLIMGPTNLP